MIGIGIELYGDGACVRLICTVCTTWDSAELADHGALMRAVVVMATHARDHTIASTSA